ncbi:acyclic terpene utilization AtuA family protein, partial [Comamonas thiooxydans]
MNDSKILRIGAGAAWWGDRIEPAALNAERGRLDYLCFETMAEATVSAAQVRVRRDPSFPGYDTYLDDRMRAVLPACMRQGTRIISNQGWINPHGAARRIVELLRELGITGVKVAAVGGSLITDRVLSLAPTILETGAPTQSIAHSLISAEAYLGAAPIVDALAEGAQIVVTGRVADPSLFLAPMVHEFGWDLLDHERVGAGSAIGHLMECGAQVTGGYFADPGLKDVPEPWNLAFPIAEVDAEGGVTLSKVEGTGGMISLQTVKEQMLYEVHDPANYITPDVVVDFTQACIEQLAPDRVRVTGLTGKPRTPTLKVSMGCTEGFIGEDMFFYAGPGALRRAQLARRILEERLRIVKLDAEEVRIDFLGLNAV